MSGGAELTLGGGGRKGGGGMLGGRGPGGKKGGILAGVSASEEECSDITCRTDQDVSECERVRGCESESESECECECERERV